MSVQSYVIIEQRMKHIREMQQKLEDLNQVLRVQQAQLELELKELRAHDNNNSANNNTEPNLEPVEGAAQ